jgi:hypothetical protein
MNKKARHNCRNNEARTFEKDKDGTFWSSFQQYKKPFVFYFFVLWLDLTKTN